MVRQFANPPPLIRSRPPGVRGHGPAVPYPGVGVTAIFRLQSSGPMRVAIPGGRAHDVSQGLGTYTSHSLMAKLLFQDFALKCCAAGCWAGAGLLCSCPDVVCMGSLESAVRGKRVSARQLLGGICHWNFPYKILQTAIPNCSFLFFLLFYCFCSSRALCVIKKNQKKSAGFPDSYFLKVEIF